MKQVVTIMAFFFLVLTALAQPDEHRGYLGISGAVALPAGKFASTSSEADQSGYAKTGYGGSVSTQILIRDYIGFAGMMGYYGNAYNTETFQKNYLASHPGAAYDFTADNYSMINLLGGPYVSIPQGILDINVKGFIGVAVCSLPLTRSTSFPGNPGDPTFMIETQKDRATAFSYGGGVNLLFYAGGNLAFFVDASYIQARPSFNAVEVRIYEDGELTALAGIDLEQPYQIFSVGAGIAVLF